jgi:hypothetical protein
MSYYSYNNIDPSTGGNYIPPTGGGFSPIGGGGGGGVNWGSVIGSFIETAPDLISAFGGGGTQQPPPSQYPQPGTGQQRPKPPFNPTPFIIGGVSLVVLLIVILIFRK